MYVFRFLHILKWVFIAYNELKKQMHIGFMILVKMLSVFYNLTYIWQTHTSYNACLNRKVYVFSVSANPINC